MKKTITALSDLIINVLKLFSTFGLSRTNEVEYRNAAMALKLIYCGNEKRIVFKALTHQKPPRRFCMLFFEVLPFTTLASSVNGKTSNKSVPKRSGGVWCF